MSKKGGYNNENLLVKIVEIQNIVLEELGKGYLNQRDIFDKIIKPKYHISIKTYQNYLGRNAKKELAELIESRLVDIKELATKLYVEQRLSIKDTARELNISAYKMRELVRHYDLKTKRSQVLLARNKTVMIDKEQDKMNRYLFIIEIQEAAKQYSDKSNNWIYDIVIKPKYKISLPTFIKYLSMPAKEELEAIKERQYLRKLANEQRAKTVLYGV